jgi:hypothetical protein
LGEQLVLGAQLQMQIQQNDKADAGPHVENEVGTTANSDKLRDTRGMRRKPDKVEAHEAHDARQNRHDRRSSILHPRIEEDDAEQERKHNLRNHR